MFLGSWLAIFAAATSFAADPAQAARDKIVVETLLRLPGYDLSGNPNAKAAVLRHLDTIQGQPQYLEIVEKLAIKDAVPPLVKLAVANPESTEGSKAAGLILKFGAAKELLAVAEGKDEAAAAKAIQALGLVGTAEAVELLAPFVGDEKRTMQLRDSAAAALGKNVLGQRQLLQVVEAGKLPKQLEFTAANALLSSPDPKIREAAAKHLTLPATADAKPLPPLSELVARTGKADRGKQVFATTGTCAKCHKVLGEGKEVGPDLSEIGSKLSEEAMFVSILNPSAGISHSFETYSLALASGNIVTGILVSQTDSDVTIKNAEAIVKTYPRDEIDELVKQPISLMPADLQKVMTVDDLVDVVEFMQTLKKKS